MSAYGNAGPDAHVDSPWTSLSALSTASPQSLGQPRSHGSLPGSLVRTRLTTEFAALLLLFFDFLGNQEHLKDAIGCRTQSA